MLNNIDDACCYGVNNISKRAKIHLTGFHPLTVVESDDSVHSTVY